MHNEEAAPAPGGVGAELGPGRGGQAPGSAHHQLAFPGKPRPAPKAGRRARELHTQPRAGRGGVGAEGLPLPLSNASPSPDPDGAQRPSHSPRLAKLSWLSRGRGKEAHRRGWGLGHPAVRTCPLAEVSGRSSSELQEAGVPHSAPESTDRAQRDADPGPQRTTQALSAAAAFYLPPAFVWVPAPTTGCGGVRGRLLSCAAPQPLVPPACAPPGLASVAGEGLRSAAHCCLWSPPPGAAVAAAPPAGAAQWYNRAHNAGGRGCERRSDPWGSMHASANGPGRDSCSDPKFPRSPGLSRLRSCLPIRTALADHQPPGQSRASPGLLQRELPNPGSWRRPSFPPSSTFLAPEPRAMPAPGTGHPSSSCTWSA